MTSKQLPEPIAIVGSACRFPGGASSPSSLWKLLQSPRDVGQEFPAERFGPHVFYHPDGKHHGTTNVKRSYFIQEDIRTFDASFFNISPNEADCMDPQARILMETVYEALESGGHAVEAMRSSDTACYVGTMTADYNDTLTRDHNTMPSYYATGTNRAIISNRVSYFFDWHGPSMTIDTACSSSLIAVHQGVQALRTGESRVALACGTQVLLNPEMYIGESKLKMLSPHGQSRMWDADANGYARGEGVAAVVLKKLSDAIADGDHIESIIRETGTNQDGFSNGLTVPNEVAQAQLIRQTYARAGLDFDANVHDGPQFFEAHGTGTQAGDPKEASAISQCFGSHAARREGTPLYVGSIKTVIGHLEGCAGLAGLLKASNMIQAGVMPPNLLFNRLNPKIEPFINGLQVSTELRPWPTLPEGVPRRISVNSFGFGGSNAHAILEQYQGNANPAPKASLSFSPFVFSAASEASLIQQLQAYSAHLKTDHSSIVPADLAWTLHSRRSMLSTKAAFSAVTLEDLASKIDAKLAEVTQDATKTVGVRSYIKPGSKILGVFTGQGAQWAAMGAHLIRSSPFAAQRIQEMEDSLAALPPSDRPSWSLTKEMLADAKTSRIAEAALSQPLCTAIQVVLIDLLRSAGITFSAAVGHSSGEIAAAYTAGFLSATDSIRIAYYRGFYAKLAGNAATGQKGAMMAAGTSWEDAQEFINSNGFKGRIAVAAHNSPASVTLSGDMDAIAQAEKIFTEQKKFARMLKVDTAYHSHHMLPCGAPYVAALKACGVRVIKDRADTSCQWFSSVTASAEPMEAIDELEGEYWNQNMTNAVLFCPAIKNAINSNDQINFAIEVGPHPALKGPATQNIAEVRPNPLPYTGVLSRGKNDIEAFSEALGFMWTNLPNMVNLHSFDKFVTQDASRKPNLVVGLPKYTWNHSRVHWSESRVSRKMRSRKQAHHEVLGFLSTESNSHEKTWLNVLKQSEVPWLDGHQLQSMTVFPAAGYVAMALEASKTLAGDRPVEVYELHDLTVPRAITFEGGDNSAGVETVVSLTGIEYHADQTATAKFACYSTPVLTTGSEQDMELAAGGTVRIVFGEPHAAALSCAPVEDYNMAAVDFDRFYSTIGELGYGYSGPFKTMSSMKRKLNYSSVMVDSYEYTDADSSQYLVHPTMLDVAFQATMLAYSAPGDDHLWSLSVPTGIKCIRVNPEVCAALPTSASKVPVSVTLDAEAKVFSSNIDILGEDGEHGMIQVEELVMKPFAPATAADDRVVYTHTRFGLAQPDAGAIVDGARPSAEEVELAAVCERITYHLMRKWKSELSNKEQASLPHFEKLLNWIERTLPSSRSEWSQDSTETIQSLMKAHADSIEVKILTAVDVKIPAVVRGETSILEYLNLEDMLAQWRKTGLGFGRYYTHLAQFTKQIAHRYPHARVLEIGAGSGEATQSILEAIAGSFSSYTFTDASEARLAPAAELFKAFSDKMAFKVLDIEKPSAEQGFSSESYDVVIASNAFGTTASIEESLMHARQLLRPGGYLLTLDVTDPAPVRFQGIAGAVSSPVFTPGKWHTALRKAGFGGVDAKTPEVPGGVWPLSVMIAQAVDDKVSFLRRPLSAPSPSPPVYVESLVILGAGSIETSQIGEELVEHLGRFCGVTVTLDSLPTEQEADILNPMSTFVILADLDSPIFEDMNAAKMDGLKRVLELAKSVTWVTKGAFLDNGYHMASVAFGRTVREESGHISFGQIDVSDLRHNASKTIAEYVLQQAALDEWEAPPSALADREHHDFSLLWSREREIFVDQGVVKVPRLVENVEQNDRINAERRVITKAVPVSDSNIAIAPASIESPPSLVQKVSGRTSTASAEQVVEVESSTLMALHIVENTFLYLGVGKGRNGKMQVILSPSNSSKIIPVGSVAAPIHGDSNATIIAVGSELVAKSLLSQLPAGSHALVHCSSEDRFLAAAAAKRAAEKAVRLTFVSDSREASGDASWIQLDSRAANHVVRKLARQAKPTHYLNLSSFSELGRRIAQALPSDCTHISIAALFQSDSIYQSQFSAHEILDRELAEAVSSATLPSSQIKDLVTPLDQVRTVNPQHASSAVQWPLNGVVEAEVRPLDASVLFSKDKTYLLVGLSGQMGQSLCEWMVQNGAGHVFLTSRRPNVDVKWLESFSGSGASVKAIALDVLDKHAIRRVVKEITATCPPIAGVLNGAMVMDDQLFANMPVESMRRVLGPKIDGSKNLDEVFYNDDLDFFVLFSSITAVYGNAGQSSYCSANGFLNALARQRRSRGLAASAIDIGRVAGIGYAEAAGQAVQDQLKKKLRLMAISETDLRQAMGETILAGYASPSDKDTIGQAVVTIGLRAVSDDEEVRGPWFRNTLFAHLIKESNSGVSGAGDGDKKSSLPVKQQLGLASSKEEGLQVLKECFAFRLRAMLQLGDQEIDNDAPLVELGIDSLVAVEVRSWFLKELKADVPVLKVIGGASLAELCEKAMESIPEELFAGAGAGKDSEKTAPAKAAAAPPRPAKQQRQPPANMVRSDSESSSVSSSSSTAASTPPSSPESTLEDPIKHLDLSKSTLDTKRYLKIERLSMPQSRFWFLRHMLQDPTTPNVVISYHITGTLRIGDLERAIRLVTNRHEALRTCFVEDENNAGEAFQKVLPRSPLQLERKKISAIENVADEYAKLQSHVFDLENGDLMRLVLLTLSSSSHYLLINYHHIVMDGGSWNVFLTDLEKGYNGQSLGAPPLQYPDFSAAQRKALANGEMADEMKYWQQVFPADEQPPVLPLLPMARTSSRVAMKGFDSHQVGRDLDSALVQRVKAFSKAQRCTPFHVHLAAFKTMLFRLAGEATQDLTIGFADAARNDDSMQSSLGFFLNLLTLRFRRDEEQSSADAVLEARKTAYAALATSRLPFDVLLSELNVARSPLHSPFFQAFLDYRQGVQEKQPWGNCQFEFQQVHPGRTAYDVTLDVTEWSGTETLVVFRVQQSLYDMTAANLLLETYIHFLDALTSDASLAQKDIPLFSKKQLAEAEEVGRGPKMISDWAPTLPHRIDEVAQESGDKVALMDGYSNMLTYSDMSGRIQSISQALQNAGVGAGSRVLVFQNPSVYWSCSMLAIMRLGAVYVPLDLRNPMVRLAGVAKDCEARAILADASTVNDAPQLEMPGAKIINVVDLAPEPTAPVANVAEAESPAAILYTSGSTGKPKGIVVTHAGLRNEIEGYTKTWGLGAERVLQQSAMTFNHSSDQMYTGLVNGGMVYVVPAEKRGDPLSITKIIQENDITYTKATPAEYSLWMQYGPEALKEATNWKFAFGGGEQLTNVVTKEFAALQLPQLRFMNSYGPTEISISSHKMELPYRDSEAVDALGRIPCGFSLPNYYTYVVDEQLRAVPVGMPGEICIGGAGVSLGYLDNEKLNSHHFVRNPFATQFDIERGWTRMYRTGDIGHLQANGAMVFRSRMAGDAQVKIRGLRIELTDIESNIVATSKGAIKEAVVTLREGGDSAFLVAHVVFAPQHSVQDKTSFLESLLSHLPLPQYMIPVLAIPIDKFPLSNHSKVDRKAVQAMALPERVKSSEDDSELTETMVQLKRVWQDVLGKNTEKFGFDLTPTTNFFLVGGNSLLVILLQSKIRKALNVAVPLVQLLGASTLGEMARVVEEHASVELIDWEKETSLPNAHLFLSNIPAKTESTGKTILITGVTGAVGKTVLPQLASRPDVEVIHCVAVREKQREKELFSSSKVVYHTGDLALPLLGLDEAEYRGLASTVDVILHLGAVRSFWDNYNVLRPSNVQPTKELVQLATPRQIPIHYISTVGVLPLDAPLDNASSAKSHIPPTDGTEGYIGTKWASERILERASEKLNIPTFVYRFLPTATEQPALKQRLMEDFISHVDASGLTFPANDPWRGMVFMTPSNDVGKYFSESVAAASTDAGAATQFAHFESPIAFHTDELVNHIKEQRSDRKDLGSLPFIKWLGRIKGLGFPYLISAQAAEVGEGGQGLQSRR